MYNESVFSGQARDTSKVSHMQNVTVDWYAFAGKV